MESQRAVALRRRPNWRAWPRFGTTAEAGNFGGLAVPDSQGLARRLSIFRVTVLVPHLMTRHAQLPILFAYLVSDLA